jgi:hypothetical protein
MDMWGRDLRYLNCRFASRQGASRDSGTDVTFGHAEIRGDGLLDSLDSIIYTEAEL